MEKARYIMVGEEDIEPFKIFQLPLVTPEQFLSKVKRKELFSDPPLKFGDCLHIGGYRNNDKFYWDNGWYKTFHSRDIGYGMIPHKFSVFLKRNAHLPLNYFEDTIYYNTNIYGWNPLEFEDQLTKNCKVGVDGVSTFFVWKGTKFNIHTSFFDAFERLYIFESIFEECSYLFRHYKASFDSSETEIHGGTEIPEYIKKHIKEYSTAFTNFQWQKYDQSIDRFPSKIEQVWLKLDTPIVDIMSNRIKENEEWTEMARVSFAKKLLTSSILFIEYDDCFDPKSTVLGGDEIDGDIVEEFNITDILYPSYD
jgi:hypothetical protein